LGGRQRKKSPAAGKGQKLLMRQNLAAEKL
jgi:hypothetical protein